MGKRGPAKTPARTLKDRGTFRGDRHSDDVDRTLAPKLPKAPEHLSEKAKSLWKNLGPKLVKHGLLTELDAISFEVLCASYAGTIEAAEQLSVNDLVVYVGELGSPMANPLVGIISKNLATLRWAIAQYGLSPAARTGIRTNTSKSDSVDPMEELLGK